MADTLPSDPPPAIEAVIAEMPDKALRDVAENAVTFLRSIDWMTREAEESAFDLAESLDAALALRPHPSPPPDAKLLAACRYWEAKKLALDAVRPDFTADQLRELNAAEGRLLAAIHEQSEPDAPTQGIAALIAGWELPLAPEPTPMSDTILATVAPINLRRDSWREGYVSGKRDARHEIAQLLAASTRPSPAGTKSTEALMADARRWHMAFNSAMRSITTGSAPEACDGPDCSICSFVLSVLTKWQREPPASPAGTREEKGTEG